jgi:hypothetical protein
MHLYPLYSPTPPLLLPNISVPPPPPPSTALISSRRRACTACQQAKRRCDQRLPRCGRCAQKGLNDCTYPSFEAGGIPPIDMSYFTDVLGANPSADSLTGMMPVVSDAENPWPLFFNAAQQQPQGPANTAVTRDAMAFCIEQFRSYPARWVRDGGVAPFIHPALYLSCTGNAGALPPILQDAFCACSAYALKNEGNAALVLGIVEAKATQLLYAPDQASWSLHQQLAALQALVMYQMIRWFDGDIRQRALADAVEPVLAAWANQLQARAGSAVFGADQDLVMEPAQGRPPADMYMNRTNSATNIHPQHQHHHQQTVHTPDADPASTPARRSPASTSHSHSGGASREEIAAAWRQWLMNESIRRVIILSYVMRGIYAMAKQGYCKLGPAVGDMSFTASRKLWKVTTCDRWNRSREQEAPWWVSRMDFTGLLALADPSDIDEFAVLMMVTYRGRDVVEDWMTNVGAGPMMSLDAA